jgi:hypothetical protein
MADGELILTATLPYTLLFLFLSLIPLYLALFCIGSKAPTPLTFITTTIAIVAFAICPYVASTQCPQADTILRISCGTAIMKVLDMFLRRHHPPTLKWSTSPAIYAFYLLIELRYESFDISTSRNPAYTFSDGREYAIHLTIFIFLQFLPQTSIVKALGVLFAIWLIWNAMHHVLKWSHSQPLFGPIYRAENLTFFWTETWHNAYTSPIRTLGYKPMRKLFGPISGVLGGFTLMAVFHVWALAPYVKPEGLFRVALFFMANGVGSIVDYWIWERRNTKTRIIVNWMYEVFWAQYAVAKCDIPDGLLAIDFKNICRVQS